MVEKPVLHIKYNPVNNFVKELSVDQISCAN